MILENLKNKNSNGFVILFAVVLSAIFLSITLGITNIALKEVKFGTSAKDTNDAFFAADTGTECALMNDKGVSSKFSVTGPSQPLTCGSTPPPPVMGNPNGTGGVGTATYTFYINNLGSNGANCAKVTVLKDGNSIPPYVRTYITSKGYNVNNSSDCVPTNPNRVERQIETSY